MTQAILHIGTPKTGTTYLQFALMLNSERLERDGWPIAETGAVRLDAAHPNGDRLGQTISHHHAAWCFERDHPLPLGVDRLSRRRLLRDLASETARRSRLLMSSECLFWELRSVDQIRLLRAALPSETIIVVWLRNRWSFIDSMYAHGVYDHGLTQTLPDYIEENLSVFNYGASLSQWEMVFGMGRVSFNIYSATRNPFADFLELLALDVADYEMPEIHANRSIPRVMVPILRECRLGIDRHLHLGDNAKVAFDMFPPARLLTDTMVSEIADQCVAGDAYLARMGMDVAAICDPSDYMQLRHVDDIPVFEIAPGLARTLDAVM